MATHPTPRRLVVALVLAGGASWAAAQTMRPAPGGMAAAAPVPAQAPAMHILQTPLGLMRVPDAAPVPGTAPAATGTMALAARPLAARPLAAPAANARVVSANGGSKRMPDGIVPGQVFANAGSRGRTVATAQRTAADGSSMRLSPVTSTTSTTAPTPQFAIVDIDPAGRTLNPADAQRKDVRFRRVDKLTSR